MGIYFQTRPMAPHPKAWQHKHLRRINPATIVSHTMRWAKWEFMADRKPLLGNDLPMPLGFPYGKIGKQSVATCAVSICGAPTRRGFAVLPNRLALPRPEPTLEFSDPPQWWASWRVAGLAVNWGQAAPVLAQAGRQSPLPAAGHSPYDRRATVVERWHSGAYCPLPFHPLSAKA